MELDAPAKPDASCCSFLRSSIGCKGVMALTGIFLLLFVVGHMLGNLQFFLGPEALNGYAAKLKAMPPLLWGSRLFLGACLAAHVGSAVLLTRRNREARPVPYICESTVQTTYAARTMMMSGLILLAFVAYHLLHLTVGATHPEHFRLHDPSGRHDVYAMVVLGFRNPLVSGAYGVAMGLLAMHVSHGCSSLFQTLGARCPRLAGWIDCLGPALAGALFIGYVSIPASVLLGIAGKGVPHAP